MGNQSTRQKVSPGTASQPGSPRAPSVPTGTAKTFNEAYTVGRDLGSGAFSVVKLATHKVTGTQVAVKIVSKKKLSEEDLAALMTEISILCELDHPHIIKCYETFDEGQDFYIITELVAGGELFDRIVAKTHYTEKEARDLVRLFLETMHYMHSKGVVHRDLKPENLLLTSDGDDADIKVADFGFAKKVTELLPNETACGTPGYVAPEILRGDPYGVEVDIWSMGVICYVLLAGYPPFYDDDQRKLFRKIKEGKYHFHQDYWGNTSPEAIDMIRKMLCVNQKERWTAGQLLQHPWITLGEDVLGQKEMTKQLETLKKYRAKLRFKKAVLAVTVGVKVKLMFKNKTPSGTQLVDPSLDDSAKVDSAKAALADGEGGAAAAAPAAEAAPGVEKDSSTAEPSAVVLESRDSVDGADVAKEKEYVGVKAKKGKSGITAEMLKELQEMEARGEIDDDNGDVPAVERM